MTLCGSIFFQALTPTCFTRQKPWLPLPTLFPFSRGSCLLFCWRSSTLVALSLTSLSRPWPLAGTVQLPPLPLVPWPLHWSQLVYKGNSVAVLTCQLPLWQWTVLPPLLRPPPTPIIRCPYRQWIKLCFISKAWSSLIRSDRPEETPLSHLGPLLLGHTLKSMAPCPLSVLPSLPHPLAFHLHMPHLIGGPGLHNAVRPTQGLPIGLPGPTPLSLYLIWALDSAPFLPSFSRRSFEFPPSGS